VLQWGPGVGMGAVVDAEAVHAAGWATWLRATIGSKPRVTVRVFRGCSGTGGAFSERRGSYMSWASGFRAVDESDKASLTCRFDFHFV